MGWYIMTTVPQGEAGASAGLVARGFRALSPMITKTIKHGRGKLIDRTWAMFPGYIFVECEQFEFSRCRAIPKVRDFLRDGGKSPVSIAEIAVRAIQEKELEIEQERLTKMKAKVKHDFKVGQSIKVTDGPFTNLLASIDSLDTRGRIVILHQLMGREVKMTLDPKDVQAA